MTCNVSTIVPLMRVRLTIVAIEKNYNYYLFWARVCSLRYPAPSAHAPYYNDICGLALPFFSTL